MSSRSAKPYAGVVHDVDAVDHERDEVDVLETAGDPASVDVRGVSHDSRRVAPGDLFCCLPGSVVDGRSFAGEAVRRGAAGVLSEPPAPALPGDTAVGVVGGEPPTNAL